MTDTSDGDNGVQPEEIRASDAEREAVVARLNTATSEGRLQLDEFSARVDRAYQARARGELDDLVRDLPATSGVVPGAVSTPAVPSAQGQGHTHWHVTPLGGLSRRGRWRVPENTVSVALIGGVSLDLREAELAAREVTLTAVTVIGGFDVTVPSGMRVEVEGFSLLGGRKVDVDERAAPDAPTLRLRVFSILGGAKIRSLRPADRRSA
ncbi:MAG TPA: DUF1707 domain-containing protein [Mycobacteriales bacterium]|jgi:hypothetical protein